MVRALLLLGLAQALSNLGHAGVSWLDPPAPTTSVGTLGEALRAITEPARGLISTASMLESFTIRLGSAAFMAFSMNVCDKEHAAVQYAALSVDPPAGRRRARFTGS